MNERLFLGDPESPTIIELSWKSGQYYNDGKPRWSVEKYTANDLDPYDRVYSWGGQEPKEYTSYGKALARFGKLIRDHGKFLASLEEGAEEQGHEDHIPDRYL